MLVEKRLNGLERLGVLRALGRVQRGVDGLFALPNELGHRVLREVVTHLGFGTLHKVLGAPGTRQDAMVSASAGASALRQGWIACLT